MAEQNDKGSSESSTPMAGGPNRTSADEAVREAVRSSRPVRHVIRLIGALALVAVAGIGVYYAGRAQGFDEGRAAPIAAASSEAEAQAARPAAGSANAAIQQSPAVEPIIPASELADLYDPPSPATPTAVAARARELCHTEATGDRAISIAELVEMASGQIAAYDAIAKHGGALTVEDKRCYRKAEGTLEEDRKSSAEAEPS